MEADFVNVYISKQKALIEDLLAKNIMLETKLSVSETTSARYKDQVESLKVEIEDKNKYINKLADNNNKLQVALNQKEEVKQPKKKKEQLSADQVVEVIAADEF